MNPERNVSHPAHRYPAVRWDELESQDTATRTFTEPDRRFIERDLAKQIRAFRSQVPAQNRSSERRDRSEKGGPCPKCGGSGLVYDPTAPGWSNDPTRLCPLCAGGRQHG